MELRNIRYFIAVAEELHFGKAAERVHIAQPALSIQIRRLETELDGRLFERSKRSVSLTEAGRLFLHEAKQIVEKADIAEATARRAFRGEIGRLRIAFTGNSAYSGLLGTSLRNYRRHYQGVEIQLTELDSRSQLQGLHDGVYDICMLPILSLELPAGVKAITLDQWPLVAGLADNHPLARLATIPMAKIRKEQFIVYSVGQNSDSVFLIRYIGKFEPEVAYKTTNMSQMLTLVGAGMGIGLFPTSMADLAQHHHVVFKPISSVKHLLDCSLAYRMREREPAVLAFVETAKRLAKKR